MDALRKSLQETRARLGATVDAAKARQKSMLKLPFAGEEALREAGGFSFYCSQSEYQLVDHAASWSRITVEQIKKHAVCHVASTSVCPSLSPPVCVHVSPSTRHVSAPLVSDPFV